MDGIIESATGWTEEAATRRAADDLVAWHQIMHDTSRACDGLGPMIAGWLKCRQMCEWHPGTEGPVEEPPNFKFLEAAGELWYTAIDNFEERIFAHLTRNPPYTFGELRLMFLWFCARPVGVDQDVEIDPRYIRAALGLTSDHVEGQKQARRELEAISNSRPAEAL